MSVELAEIYSKQAHLTSAWAKILAYEPPSEPRRMSHARPRNLSRRLSPDQVQAIIEGYQAGQDSRQLATQFNIRRPVFSGYYTREVFMCEGTDTGFDKTLELGPPHRRAHGSRVAFTSQVS
jgi:hypothetical protein